MKYLPLMALGLLLPLPSLAQDAADPDMTARYQNSAWTYPTATEMADFYPAEAQAYSTNGQAVIDCMIAPSGALTTCRIISESPGGYEFGVTTVKLFLKWCHVDPATVTGGIQDGDHRTFTMEWTIGR